MDFQENKKQETFYCCLTAKNICYDETLANLSKISRTQIQVGLQYIVCIFIHYTGLRPWRPIIVKYNWIYLNGHSLTFQCLGSILPMSLIWYFCHFFIFFLINKYKSLNTIEINNWNKIKGIFYVLPRYNDWSENNILPGICEFWYLWLNQNTSTLSNSDKVRGV